MEIQLAVWVVLCGHFAWCARTKNRNHESWLLLWKGMLCIRSSMSYLLVGAGWGERCGWLFLWKGMLCINCSMSHIRRWWNPYEYPSLWRREIFWFSLKLNFFAQISLNFLNSFVLTKMPNLLYICFMSLSYICDYFAMLTRAGRYVVSFAYLSF